MSESEFADYWYERTASDILYGLILKEIAKHEGIEITEEERHQVIQQIAEQNQVDFQTAEESEEAEDRMENLLIEKTLQFLWDVADVTEEEFRIQSQSEQTDNEE